MKFVLIFGPSAVGKMSVGQALAEQTGLKLFHNHMSLELAYCFFDFGTPSFRRLSELFRFEIFKEVAKSDLLGMIFTFVWAFDLPKEEAYVDRIITIFQEANAEIFYVELEAAFAKRLERNKHPHRLQHKPSKRNIENSEKVFKHHEDNYRLNSNPGEFTRPNYIRINNDELSPIEVAEKIIQEFSWYTTNA